MNKKQLLYHHNLILVFLCISYGLSNFGSDLSVLIDFNRLILARKKNLEHIEMRLYIYIYISISIRLYGNQTKIKLIKLF